MEPKDNLSEMEVVEVLDDQSIKVTRKINSATRQNHHVKAKAAKKETLKTRKVDGGRVGGGHAGRERGGGRGLGRGDPMVSPTVQTPPWPDHYKAL